MGGTSRILTTVLGGFLFCAAVSSCGRNGPVVPALGSFTAGKCAAQRPLTLHQVLWPAARRELTPSDPVAIQLCRYDAGLHRPVLRLVSSRRLTTAKAVAFFAGELAGASATPRQRRRMPVRRRLPGDSDPHVLSSAEPCGERRASGVRDGDERRRAADGVWIRHASKESSSFG